MAVCARSRRTRLVHFSREAPTRWHPTDVRNPEDPTTTFTDEGAWLLIADLLDSDHPIKSEPLRLPPGKMGYVLLVEIAADLPKLYIKLQVGSGKVIGRSFHLSKH
jgi:hypothetical protein